ncbi:MAG TPA: mycofactocin biosynthesis glycosyltransferase MftF [Mycobacteriales bacterium]|nr:mycofactocin biosynthesis glycosyltransferase MftF [Mycobacteriales bacterium]
MPDATLRVRAGGALLLGGAPRRLLRLTPSGRRAALQLLAGAPVSTPAQGLLARRLTTAGMAHPVPTAGGELTVTAVVPVRDRPEALARCLRALGALDVPTVVVDDGSDDPAAIRTVCAGHAARVLRHACARGPAAARNLGVAQLAADVVAFVDSDIVAGPDSLPRLLAHLADPQVVAVAPRVLPDRASGAGGRPAGRVLRQLLAVRSPLDLGAQPAQVQPGTAVPFVPTACLLVRRTALPAFDEALRYGEDVDLIWRLIDAGGIVRYDPSVQVAHAEPTTWRGALARRHRYGGSAGPLARRHGLRLAHLRLGALPLTTAVALVVAPARVSGPVAAAAAAWTGQHLRRAGLPPRAAGLLAGQAHAGAACSVGSYLTLLAPLLPAAALLTTRTRRRLTAVVLAPLAAEYLGRRPRLDPLTWLAAAMLDDVAYASGVWRGCLRARTAAPLLPNVRFRPRPRPGMPPAPAGFPAAPGPDRP